MTYKQALMKARGYALSGNKAECQKWLNQAGKRGRVSHETLVSLDKTLRAGLKRLGSKARRKGQKVRRKATSARRKNPLRIRIPNNKGKKAACGCKK